MDALKKYYMDVLCNLYLCWDDDSVDLQYTKERVEKILETGSLSNDDIEFLRSLLPEVESRYIREDLEEWLERYDV